MNEPALSTKSYLLAYVALLGLLAANIFIGYLNLGWASMFITVTIATLQAAIVSLILMYGLFETALVKLAMAGALVWFMILMTLTMTDYITRNWLPVAGK